MHVPDDDIASVLADLKIAEKESKTEREFVERLLASISMLRPILVKVI